MRCQSVSYSISISKPCLFRLWPGNKKERQCVQGQKRLFPSQGSHLLTIDAPVVRGNFIDDHHSGGWIFLQYPLQQFRHSGYQFSLLRGCHAFVGDLDMYIRHSQVSGEASVIPVFVSSAPVAGYGNIARCAQSKSTPGASPRKSVPATAIPSTTMIPTAGDAVIAGCASGLLMYIRRMMRK